MKCGLGEHDEVDLIILSSDRQNYMGYTLKRVHAHVQQGCAAWLWAWTGPAVGMDWACSGHGLGLLWAGNGPQLGHVTQLMESKLCPEFVQV